MTRVELRTSKKVLEDEKGKLDRERITISDKRTAKAEELARLRATEFSHMEASKQLSNKESSKPARSVLQTEIKTVRLQIQEVEKQLEELNKQYMVVDSRLTAIEGSIRELANA